LGSFSGEDDVGQQYPRPAKFKFTKHQSYPDAYTIFDYFYDKRKNGQWMTWLETVERPTFPPNLRPSDLIIPTNVTCMQNFFINLYLQNDVPMMFVGPTGRLGSLGSFTNQIKSMYFFSFFIEGTVTRRKSYRCKIEVF
jgi:hypothetical protein